MIDPKMKNGYPVKKYSDEQIEKCKQKIDFIKNKLINVNIADIEYQSMVDDILKDYERKLWEMENEFMWIPYSETIYLK